MLQNIRSIDLLQLSLKKVCHFPPETGITSQFNGSSYGSSMPVKPAETARFCIVKAHSITTSSQKFRDQNKIISYQYLNFEN